MGIAFSPFRARVLADSAWEWQKQLVIPTVHLTAPVGHGTSKSKCHLLIDCCSPRRRPHKTLGSAHLWSHQQICLISPVSRRVLAASLCRIDISMMLTRCTGAAQISTALEPSS